MATSPPATLDSLTNGHTNSCRYDHTGKEWVNDPANAAIPEPPGWVGPSKEMEVEAASVWAVLEALKAAHQDHFFEVLFFMRAQSIQACRVFATSYARDKTATLEAALRLMSLDYRWARMAPAVMPPSWLTREVITRIHAYLNVELRRVDVCVLGIAAALRKDMACNGGRVTMRMAEGMPRAGLILTCADNLMARGLTSLTPHDAAAAMDARIARHLAGRARKADVPLDNSIQSCRRCTAVQKFRVCRLSGVVPPQMTPQSHAARK